MKNVIELVNTKNGTVKEAIQLSDTKKYIKVLFEGNEIKLNKLSSGSVGNRKVSYNYYDKATDIKSNEVITNKVITKKEDVKNENNNLNLKGNNKMTNKNTKKQIIESILNYSHVLSKDTLKKENKKHLLALYNSVKNEIKLSNTITKNTPKIDLKSINTKSYELVTGNYTSATNDGKVLFKTISESKEVIKKHKAIISDSYAKLMPLISNAINAKKILYPNMSNKNLLKLIKVDFNTKDKLVSDSFYLKENNITLPFGVNKNQLAFIVKNVKNEILSKSSVKNHTLESLIKLIEVTKAYLSELAKIAIYEDIKKSKESEIIDVKLIA